MNVESRLQGSNILQPNLEVDDVPGSGYRDATPRDVTPPNRQCLLVIEDDPAVASLLRTLAENPGCKVLQTSDGPAALQLAATVQPSVVILDLGLPDLDGRAILTALKQNPLTAQIPVIIISAFAHLLSSEERALTAAIFRKPFPTRKLVKAIEKALKSAPQRTTAQ